MQTFLYLLQLCIPLVTVECSKSYICFLLPRFEEGSLQAEYFPKLDNIPPTSSLSAL